MNGHRPTEGKAVVAVRLTALAGRPVRRQGRHALRALGCIAVIAAVGVVFAPSADAGKTGKSDRFVVYTVNRDRQVIDRNQPGPDNTDLVHHAHAISRTQGGPAIGDAYAQSEVVALDASKGIDVRLVEIRYEVPGGWIFTRGISTLPIGTFPQPGWTATYAVVGGTGKYAGARGTEKLTLLDDLTVKHEFELRR